MKKGHKQKLKFEKLKLTVLYIEFEILKLYPVEYVIQLEHLLLCFPFKSISIIQSRDIEK